MQQYVNFEQDLNYIPYRYRNRSNPQPKKILLQTYSHSQSKRPKFNPQHITITKNAKLGFRNMIEVQNKRQGQKQENTPHRKNGLNMNQFELFDSVIASLFSPSDSSVESQQKVEHKEQFIEERYIKDLSFNGNQENKQSSQQQIEQIENNTQQVQENANLRMSQVFNQFWVEQMKQGIIQNIEQSNKHQQQIQPEQTYLIKKLFPNKPFSRFEQRYQRLKVLNREHQQRQKQSRNTKLKQIIQSAKNNNKYSKKTKQQKHHSPSLKCAKQIQISSKFQQLNFVPNEKIVDNNILHLQQHQQQMSNNNNNKVVSKLTFAEGGIKPAHLHNSTSSYNKQISSNYNYKNNVTPKPLFKPNQLQKPTSKISQIPKQQTFSLLSYFTKDASNKAIKSLKEQKIKQKIGTNSLQPSQPQTGYSTQAKINSNGYTTKMSNTQVQTYSVNMKKKKEKIPIIELTKAKQKTINQKYPNRCRQISEQNSKYEQSSIKLNQQSNKSSIDESMHSSFVYEPSKSNQQSRSQALLQQSHQNLQSKLPSQNYQEQYNEISVQNSSLNQIHSHPISRVQEKQSYRGQSSSVLKSQDEDEILKMIDSAQLQRMLQEKDISSYAGSEKMPSEYNNNSINNSQINSKQAVNSNQQHSAYPSPQNFSISSESSSSLVQDHFEEQISFNLRQQLSRQLFRSELRQQVEGKTQSLLQINQDSMVFPQHQINRYQSQNLMRINIGSLNRKSQLLDSLNPISRRTNQAQIDQNSIRQYRNHFHPKNDAIRKFKHAKHSSSADVQEKTLKSSRINHSLSTLKRNGFNLQIVQRRKTRKQKNATRFKTRMT